MKSASLQRLFQAKAIFAGWLMLFLLMRATAADLDLVSTNTSAIESQSAPLHDIVPAEPETANPAETAKPQSVFAATPAATFEPPTASGASVSIEPGRE